MKQILCIGGNGKLGTKIIEALSKHQVTCLDYHHCSLAANNIKLPSSTTIKMQHKYVLHNIAASKVLYDSVLVVAGGWVGGSIQDKDCFKKAKLMMKKNLYPSILGAHIATRFLKPQGLVVFTGAAAVFKQPQPDMLAYGLAKTAVHSLAMNLAEQAKANKFSGRVVTILPEVIDTLENRKSMPSEDFTKWAKPEQISQLLLSWIEGNNIPNNGSFAVLGVKNGCVVPTFV